MNLLRSSILLLPMLTLACEGPAGMDGTDGTDGVDATDGADGSDGSDGVDGADGSAIAHATLLPGEYLSLEHELGAGDKYYQAQFSWNGVVYDHSDYAMLRPAHLSDGMWMSSDALENFEEVSAAVLASGDMVVVQHGYDDNDDDYQYTVDIRDSKGEVQATLDTVPNESEDYQWFGDSVVVALGDGGFVVFFEYESSSMDIIRMDRYDALGVLVNTEALGEEGHEYNTVRAVPTADGGFAAALGGYSDGSAFVEVVLWSPTAGMSTLSIEDTSGDDARIAPLDDGRIALLVERRLGEDAPRGIDFLIAQTDGTLDVEVRLQNSYITDSCSLVLGSQGTLLVAAESGGPDLPFFAVLDTAGNVVQDATGMSGWENDNIQAAAFPDGDFFIMVSEDDSLAPMTWVVGAQGGLLRPMVVGDMTAVPGYRNGVFLPSTGNNIAHLTPSYDSSLPAYMSTYTKGLLQIRVESDDEVRLYNETPETLDVTMAAHRTP